MNVYVKVLCFISSIVCSNAAFGMQQMRRLLPCLFYKAETTPSVSTIDVGVHTIASQFHDHNEDVSYAQTLPSGGLFYGVFDGHGPSSHIFARTIAQKLYDAVNLALIKKSTLSQELFTYIWIEVDKAVCKEWIGNNQQYIPGCTAVVIISYKGKIWLLNTGDSQALIMKKDNTFFVSEPHTVLRQKTFDTLFAQESGHIVGISRYCCNQKKFIRLGSVTASTVCDAQGDNNQLHTFVTKKDVLHYFNLDDVDSDKVLGRMSAYVAMSNSFGDVYKGDNKKITFSAAPDCTCFDQNDIAWIVLGSDGLWDFCDAALIIESVTPMAKGNYTPSAIAQFLCKKALHKHQQDDVTVMVLFFNFV